jgi:hypothetical protein
MELMDSLKDFIKYVKTQNDQFSKKLRQESYQLNINRKKKSIKVREDKIKQL